MDLVRAEFNYEILDCKISLEEHPCLAGTCAHGTVLFANSLCKHPSRLAVSAITAQKRTEKGNTKYKNCSDTEVLKQF
jgi:hypothetical protein